MFIANTAIHAQKLSDFDIYQNKINSYANKISIKEQNNQNITYIVDFKEFNFTDKKMQSFIKEANFTDFYKVQLIPNTLQLEITVNANKVKIKDVAHNLLWRNGIQ